MRHAPPPLAFLAALAAASLAGCGDGGGEGTGTGTAAAWRPVAESELGAEEQRQRDRALAAKGAMFQELFRTLKEEMERGGPAGAIAVCRDRAPAIAQAVGKSHGLSIGRTSFLLRNPRNTPPAWVEPIVAERPSEPRFAAGPEGRFGAVLPIRLLATCLPCHGPAESLAEDVRARLREVYPEDRAVGFRDGDLRGWFWVEVPKAP